MAKIYYGESLLISAGAVHDRETGRPLAHAKGGKVIKFCEDETPLTDGEKQRIADFVAEADAAPEN